MTTVVTIHQPSFLPWMPFFDKVRSADMYVVLSECQYEKNGYQNRFFYRGKWHTLSVNKGMEPIKNKRYVNPYNDWEKIKLNLPDKAHVLSQFDDLISDNLLLTNMAVIKRCLRLLNINTAVVLDPVTALTGTDRLVDICRYYGADVYLSGPSGKSYMDTALFDRAGIAVRYCDSSDSSSPHVLDVLG